MRPFLPCLGLVLLCGCGPSSDATMALPGEGGFFEAPFPSEVRRRTDGTISVMDLPMPTESELIRSYLAALESDTEAGFGLTSPIYLPAPGTGLRDWDRPEVLLDPVEHGVFLLPIDPNRMDIFGQPVPIEVQVRTDEDDWHPGSMVTLMPALGVTLQPDTLYAAGVLADGRIRGADNLPLSPHPELVTALGDLRREQASELPLATDLLRTDFALAQLGLDGQDLVTFTAFRTGDPVAAMEAAVDQVLQLAAEQPPMAEIVAVSRQESHCRVEVAVSTPQFQRGSAPYLSAPDGQWVRDALGDLVIQRWEEVHIGLSIPTQVAQPAEGFRLMLHSHGTGGSRYTMYQRSNPVELLTAAGYLAAQGIATATPDAPQHGLRDEVGLDGSSFFNIFNPHALRDNIRQAALEMVWLTEALGDLSVPAELCPPAPRFDWSEARLDTGSVGMWGHSQGGNVAPLWLATDPRAGWGVLTGAGGHWGQVVLGKTEPLVVSSLIAPALGLEPEEMDLFDAPLGLLQTFGEAGDGLVYAPEFPPEMPVLFLAGLEDNYVSERNMYALAAAGGASLYGEPRSEALDFVERTGGIQRSFGASESPGVRALTLFDAVNGEGHFVAFQGLGNHAARQIACFAATTDGATLVINDDSPPAEPCR